MMEELPKDSVLRALVREASDGFMVFNEAFEIVYANNAAHQIFGYSQQTLVGQPLNNLIPERLRARHDLHRMGFKQSPEMSRTMFSRGMEILGLRLSGEELPVSITLVKIEDDEGNLTATIIRDISPQKNAEKAKDEFLAMLAHELRNPLAPIGNALEIWKRGDAGDKLEKEAQLIMGRQLQNMLRLVDDLLDVARITRGVIELKKGPVDLVQLINQAVEGTRHHCNDRRHELSLSLPKEKVFVNGDALRLEQVVSNLLINAAKYTETGGRIAVTLEREADNALIRVSDNGVGISPELLPYVFDLFVQAERSLDREKGGLGLGLTLVRRLVELHGGTVGVKSQGLKKGSEFIVRLPMMSGADVAVPAAPPVAPQKLPFVKRRILVIDDNVDSVKVTQMLLELRGHEIQTALDGLSGIKTAQIFKPEVILLDIGLPGMNGYEVARRLRELPETQKALLIAVSGYGQVEDRRKSKEAGFDHHLVKPADINKLQDLISG